MDLLNGTPYRSDCWACGRYDAISAIDPLPDGYEVRPCMECTRTYMAPKDTAAEAAGAGALPQA